MNLKTQTVNVNIETGEHGLYYGTSDQLKGLLIAERTPDEVLQAAPKAMADFYLADGFRDVETIQVDTRSWIVRGRS